MKQVRGLILGMLVLVLAACSQQAPSEQAVLRTQDFGSAGDDTPTDMVANSTGVYIVGTTTGALEGRNLGGNDAFIRKYQNGGVAWAKQFGTRSFDSVNGVAVDSAGNTYVVGVTSGALGFKQGGSSDCFLRKYNTSGGVVWTRQFGSGIQSDACFGIKLGATNSIYIGGFFNSPEVFYISKWDQNGNALWTQTVGTELLGLRAFAVDSAGNVFSLSGSSGNVKLFKRTSSGATVQGFPKTIYNVSGAIPYDIEIDSSNNIYITLTVNNQAYLRKMNSNGGGIWMKSLEYNLTSSATEPTNLTVDGTNLYAGVYGITPLYAGDTNTKTNAYVIKYSSGGTRLCTGLLSGQQDSGNERVTGIAVSDKIYLTGRSDATPTNILGDPSYGGIDPYVAQFDKNNCSLAGIDQ
jgi:hypothetical protein